VGLVLKPDPVPSPRGYWSLLPIFPSVSPLPQCDHSIRSRGTWRRVGWPLPELGFSSPALCPFSDRYVPSRGRGTQKKVCFTLRLPLSLLPLADLARMSTDTADMVRLLLPFSSVFPVTFPSPSKTDNSAAPGVLQLVSFLDLTHGLPPTEGHEEDRRTGKTRFPPLASPGFTPARV